MGLGSLLVAAALCLALYNVWDENRAEESAEQILTVLEAKIQEGTDETPGATEIVGFPDYVLNPDMEMPVSTIDGHDYIGVLEIPALGLSLPIMSQWSYPNLKIAPCRYTGSVYQDNLVLCAHNYAKHFGNLKNLQPGVGVNFTDNNGNTFSYEVAELSILEPTAVEEMQSGNWDLTLFTCTYGGKTRVTVRCVKI